MLAVVIGTQGIGLTGQLATLVALLAGIVALGLSNAAIKLVAEAEQAKDEDSLRRVAAFVFWAPLTAGVLLLVPAAAFAPHLAALLVGDVALGGYLTVSLLSVPLLAAVGSLQVVMQGRGLVTRMATASLIGAVCATAVSVVLTLAFGLAGAVAALPAASLTSVLVIVIREPWLVALIRRPALPGRAARRLFGTMGLAGLVATAATTGADTALRALVIQDLGLDASGLYYPVFLLSTVVFAQLAGSLAAVLFPALAGQLSSGRRDEAEETLRRGVRIGVLVVVPLVLTLLSIRSVALSLVFTSAFVEAAPVLAVQLLGELPRMFAYTLGAVLLPAGLVRAWLLTGLVATVVRLTSGLLLLPSLGLYALAWSYVVEWVIVAVLTSVVVARKCDLRAGAENVRLLTVGGAVVAAAFGLVMLAPGWTGALGAAACALVWVARAPRRGELRWLLADLRRRVDRRNRRSALPPEAL